MRRLDSAATRHGSRTRATRATRGLRPLALLAAATLLLAYPLTAQGIRAEPQRFELTLVSHQALVRSALDVLVAAERTVPQFGAEVSIPTGWRPLRVTGRFLRSPHGQADLRSRDAALVLGGRVLALAVGYGDRGSYDPASGLAHHRDAAFGRLGVRLRWPLDESGFLLHLSADGYMALRPAVEPTARLKGAEATTGLTWRHALYPVTATLGYRLERFRIFGFEQDVRALTFALGYVSGGH